MNYFFVTLMISQLSTVYFCFFLRISISCVLLVCSAFKRNADAFTSRMSSQVNNFHELVIPGRIIHIQRVDQNNINGGANVNDVHGGTNCCCYTCVFPSKKQYRVVESSVEAFRELEISASMVSSYNEYIFSILLCDILC